MAVRRLSPDNGAWHGSLAQYIDSLAPALASSLPTTPDLSSRQTMRVLLLPAPPERCLRPRVSSSSWTRMGWPSTMVRTDKSLMDKGTNHKLSCCTYITHTPHCDGTCCLILLAKACTLRVSC